MPKTKIDFQHAQDNLRPLLVTKLQTAAHTSMDEMLKVKEAAAALRIGVSTLREWCAARKIGCIRPSRRILLVPRSEVERLLNESTVPALPTRR